MRLEGSRVRVRRFATEQEVTAKLRPASFNGARETEAARVLAHAAGAGDGREQDMSMVHGIGMDGLRFREIGPRTTEQSETRAGNCNRT